MEYVYGALVLHAAGQKITGENLKKVLTAAGVKVDETRVKALTAALEGVNVDEVLASATAMAPAAAPTRWRASSSGPAIRWPPSTPTARRASASAR